MAGEHQKPMFKEITADDPDQQPTEIESYCINCGKNVMSSQIKENLRSFF
jgi:hypothetical protein